ncbi:universal stress protein [Pseudodesulfovibrio cashew]|uniref:Universal stress protein n=1 Tax=Pseudodesulfovibrio cashew TaxID=2678688 RepID=A0A6I6JG44_9BACT|nr:universal stress protein [Pseudodesulfovibrio cashew]QGY39473.1 universal stress protein [Pseudodesulfovibrio cashew]
MKLLVAVDENAYSRYAVHQAARLAANTWPDMVMLAIEKNRTYVDEDDLNPEEAHPKIRLLHRCRTDFLEALGPDVDLYGREEDLTLAHKPGKVLEENASGRKSFLLHLRHGDPVKAITAEARAEKSDLVIVGCGHHDAAWGRGSDVPGKVADAVECSVYIIRENMTPSRVVCCLDHAHVSQESLELINQWVTLYGAELEVAGVLKHGDLRENVEAKMTEVLDYYLDRGIQARVRVVDESSLEAFIEAGGENDLMALWLHHQSPLKRLFSTSKVASLVNHASSSMLILR